jgi:hypothetical protein
MLQMVMVLNYQEVTIENQCHLLFALVLVAMLAMIACPSPRSIKAFPSAVETP